MKTSDLIRTEIKRHQRPGRPVDTETQIEAIGAAIDIKLSHLSTRIARLEEALRKEEA